MNWPILLLQGVLCIAAAAILYLGLELSDRERKLQRALADGRALAKERDPFRECYAKALSYIDGLDDDRYASLDDILRNLPKGPDSAPIFRAYELPGIEAWVSAADISFEQTVTMIDFDMVDICFNDRRYRGWKRGGWILIPEEVKQR